MSVEGSDSLVGQVLGGKYRVMARVGEGGMGALYMAQHTELGRPVAVKVLVEKLSKDEKYLRRFQQEAKLAASLNHPNVTHVYDYGQLESGAPYLVMDYLEGKTLAALLQERGYLSVAASLPIFQQICKGLAHAHGRGLVHRDLKPSNIMLTESDGERIAKVLDFGIAKEVDNTQHLTQTGELFGSPLYMSPEQCSGTQIDARSDIYSIGCLLYEVLSGNVPLRGDTIVQTIFKHMNELPPPIKEVCPPANVSPAVEEVIRKAMAKNRDDRYQTVGEMSEALARAVSGAASAPAPAVAAGGTAASAVAPATAAPFEDKTVVDITGGGTAKSGAAASESPATSSKSGGIVISPIAGIAILLAAFALLGAVALIVGVAGRNPPDRPPPEGQSSVSLNVPSADGDAAQEAADQAQDAADAEQDRRDEAQDQAEGDPDNVQIGPDGMTIRDKNGKTVRMSNGSIFVDDGKGKRVSLGMGGMGGGPEARRVQFRDKMAARWKRNETNYPLITWSNPVPTGEPEMLVVYAHQAWDQSNGQDNDYQHIGHIDVNLSIDHPNVILVLCGYAPIVWNVRAEDGVKIQKVILDGLHQQSVGGIPATTTVIESSERVPDTGENPFGYVERQPQIPFYSLNVSGGENLKDYSPFVSLAKSLKKFTGRPISMFQYCSREKEFSF